MRNRTTHALAVAALLAVAASSDLGAQAAAPVAPRFRFGITAGLNFANMSELDDSDMRTGFIIGGHLVMPFGPTFAFQPEVLYSQKGAKGTTVDEESGEEIDIELKHDYVEIPLLLRMTIVPASGGVRPYLLLGPSIGLSMSCEIEGEANGVSVGIDCDELVEPSSVDVGAALGGGIEFPVGTRAMSLGVRYTLGLSEVFEEDESKNRVLAILAGFTF
jgi:hypothetical protein